jgi:hypothetical protein
MFVDHSLCAEKFQTESSGFIHVEF